MGMNKECLDVLITSIYVPVRFFNTQYCIHNHDTKNQNYHKTKRIASSIGFVRVVM